MTASRKQPSIPLVDSVNLLFKFTFGSWLPNHIVKLNVSLYDSRTPGTTGGRTLCFLRFFLSRLSFVYQ